MSDITITIPLSAFPDDTQLNTKDLIKALNNKESLELELKDSRELNTKMMNFLTQAVQELQDILNSNSNEFVLFKALRSWSDEVENKAGTLKTSYICDIP